MTGRLQAFSLMRLDETKMQVARSSQCIIVEECPAGRVLSNALARVERAGVTHETTIGYSCYTRGCTREAQVPAPSKTAHISACNHFGLDAPAGYVNVCTGRA